MKKKRILLSVLAGALLLTGFLCVFFIGQLWIVPGQRVGAVVEYDYFSGRHMQLGEGAEIYEIADVDFLRADSVRRRSEYRFVLKDENGVTAEVTAYYPGTPKRQYYGLPRLRASMDLLVIADPDDRAHGSLDEGYWLFVQQTIDGEDYVYPLLYDDALCPYSSFGERIPFSYREESRIYHPWYDADVLKKYEKCGNCEYAYKVRYSDFISNYTKILHG